MELNNTLQSIAPSKSVTLMAKTKAMQKVDKDIINMTGGEPDFDTPKAICDEAYKQMLAGYTHYTDGPGIPELRQAISKKLKEENHADFTADQVLVTPGAKLAVYLAVRAVLNPGDEAIWLTPGWVSYPSIVEASGGVPVAVHLKWDEDYRITYEALKAAASEKTRLLIINYPNNPTGKILSESDREAIARFMREYPDVVLLSDEIYEKILYSDNEVVSMASYEDLKDRVIIINGFSKCSAMTGWRLGYLACSTPIYKVVMKLFQHTMSCTSGFLQKAALVAMECTDETEAMRVEYEKRSQMLYEGLNKIPGVEMMRPEGAFYAWVSFDLDHAISRLENETACDKHVDAGCDKNNVISDTPSGNASCDRTYDSEWICNALLDRIKVAGVPGNAYGEEDKLCVRYSFATSMENIKEMISRLADLLG